MPDDSIDLIQLHWDTDGRETQYRLTALSNDGQWSMLGCFTQGPFDTSLEVAQWAWRTLAKVLPRSTG